MSQDASPSTRPRYELNGRTVLITGASSGIGRALAIALAARGAAVVLVARRRERLEALAAEIAAAGGTAHVHAADLSRRGVAARAASQITEQRGPVDVLVNNAGSAVGGPVWAVADSIAAREYFEVDLWSPLALIGEMVPGMRRRGHGAIVNVTSIRSVLAWPSFGHSSAACAALGQITETLRLELRRFGVAVIEVIPGPIDTPAQGPTALIPGIEAVHQRFGMSTPEELATQIVAALESGQERVFCPDATTRSAYEDPMRLRDEMASEVQRLLPDGSGLPDELLDTFVVSADNPMILDAREEWERQHEE